MNARQHVSTNQSSKPFMALFIEHIDVMQSKIMSDITSNVCVRYF